MRRRGDPRARPVAALAVATACLCPAPGAGATPVPQQGEAAERLFVDARRLEEEGELGAALRQYAELVRRFPDSDVADDALLRVAEIHWGRGDLAGAAAAIEELLDRYGRSPSAAGAMVLQGRLEVARARDPAALREARTTFGRVPVLYGLDAYRALEWRAEARVRSGWISLALGELEAAAAAFVAAAEDEPPSPWTPAALAGLGEALLRQGDWVAAAELFQEVAAAPATGPRAPDAGDPGARCRRRLGLIRRLIVRRGLGQEPWSGARRLSVPGLRFDEPVGVAAREDGGLLLVDEGIPFVAVVGGDGALQRRLPLKEVRLPWWGVQGAPYFPQRGSVVQPFGDGRLRFAAPRGDEVKPLEDLVAGEVGLFGHVFLVDKDRRRVLMFEPEGGYLKVLSESEAQEPVDLARDARGRLYVLDRRRGAVTRYAPHGVPEGQVASGQWRRPVALAVDGLGNVYVLDRDRKQVLVFDRRGQPVLPLGPRLPGGIELRSPRDLAVDGAGRLYIADRGLGAVVVLE